MDTDVLVVGGGVSGAMAAVAAARAGARTVLLEREGFLGGSLTNAGVGPMMTFHAGQRQVVRGLAQELIDRLQARGETPGHIEDTTGYASSVTPFDPEGMKRALDEMAREAGCRVVLSATLADARTVNGRVESVRAATKEGLLTFAAETFVDATGDGDLCARAGAETALGRDSDGLCQPMTLNIRVGNVDIPELKAEIRRNPLNFNIRDLSALDRAPRLSLAGFYAEWARAKAEGRVDCPREDVLLFETNTPGEVILNTTRVSRLCPVRADELSAAEREGRRQAREVFAFLRADCAGFSRAALLSTGPRIGVRESRRLRGAYVLTAEDLTGARAFPDAVALGGYPIDIHNPAGGGTNTVRLPRGHCYAIPYRALVAARPGNLLACGRCLSATHEALAAVRVSPIAMATGQAAGTAAAMCGGDSPGLDADALRDALRRAGAEVDL